MRIAFVGNYARWGSFDPTWLEEKTGRMLGGGETALIQVTKELHLLGHTVHVLVPGAHEKKHNGVSWHCITQEEPEANAGYLLRALGKFDVIVGCDMPYLFAEPVEAKVRVLDSQCNHGIEDDSVANTDFYVARSGWHKEALQGRLQKNILDQFFVIPNGYDPRRYAKPVPKVPGRMVWSSSPDRGLLHMLNAWPAIRKEVPEATLEIYYEFDRMYEERKWGMDRWSLMVVDIKEKLDQEGVNFIGPVDQWTLAKAQLQADMFVYPCDTVAPSEGFCITALENMAAGNPCAMTDCDALGEVYKDSAAFMPIPHVEDSLASVVYDLATNGERRADLTKKGAAFAAGHTWHKVAVMWDKALTKMLKERGG